MVVSLRGLRAAEVAGSHLGVSSDPREPRSVAATRGVCPVGA
jgi:hypothetical protein